MIIGKGGGLFTGAKDDDFITLGVVAVSTISKNSRLRTHSSLFILVLIDLTYISDGNVHS